MWHNFSRLSTVDPARVLKRRGSVKVQKLGGRPEIAVMKSMIGVLLRETDKVAHSRRTAILRSSGKEQPLCVLR